MSTPLNSSVVQSYRNCVHTSADSTSLIVKLPHRITTIKPFSFPNHGDLSIDLWTCVRRNAGLRTHTSPLLNHGCFQSVSIQRKENVQFKYFYYPSKGKLSLGVVIAIACIYL